VSRTGTTSNPEIRLQRPAHQSWRIRIRRLVVAAHHEQLVRELGESCPGGRIRILHVDVGLEFGRANQLDPSAICRSGDRVRHQLGAPGHPAPHTAGAPEVFSQLIGTLERAAALPRPIMQRQFEITRNGMLRMSRRRCQRRIE
jgi:hypothetical protein